MSIDIDINLRELEHFVDNRVWKIIIQAAIDRTNDEVNNLMQKNAFQEPDAISKSQGCIEGMNFLVDYPAILKEQLEYKQKEEGMKDGR